MFQYANKKMVNLCIATIRPCNEIESIVPKNNLCEYKKKRKKCFCKFTFSQIGKYVKTFVSKNM